MRAAVWHGARDVRVEDVPVPSPGPGEVAIDVAYCGICGSDLHEYLDGPHALPVRAPHPESGRTAPLTLGHEFCGTVADVGPDVAGIGRGDRVAVEPHYRCGACARCRAGEYNLCRHFGFAGLMGDGGLAERAVVPAYMAHVLPDGVSLEQAAVFEPAAVALHGVRRSGLRDGETVAVAGLGPIGLLVVRLAARYGAGRVVACDPSPARRALALRFGAAEAVDAGALPPGAADVAFEAVGLEATLRDCLAATRRGGRTVLLGLGGTLTIDGFALVNEQKSIVPSVGYAGCHPELIRLVAEEGMDFTPIVTSTIPLGDVVSAGFEALTAADAHTKDEIKVLVRP
ncbi:2,3-butanediol dehydrogenase [Actinomadura sediminis]|uniref:2,3-butanediol dehydrogenase n=1 Tax=Actinomadura sediminis TaxID=1038904 RepID=A0ABW3ET82_9ACTN